MGTAGNAGLSGFVVGTTAERLVSHLKCSVIAVKPAGLRVPGDPGSLVRSRKLEL